MSQIIRLNESDLLNIVKRVLLEGKKDNPEKRVKASYQLMIDGAKGGGTSPKSIISGIKKLKNKEEFYRLNYLFKDNKTGYKSFNEMIKGEFEYVKLFGLNNSDDFETLKKEFNRLGVEIEEVTSKKQGFKFINLGKGDKPLAGGDNESENSDNESENSDNESELDDDNDTKKDNTEKRIKASYQLMIDGAKGVGTNPKYIINGIKKLKNKEEFYRLNYLFKDNKTGYKSFNEMIKGEFGYGKIGSNENDYKQLASLFKKLGLDYLTNSDRSKGFVFNNMGKGNKPIVDDETSKTGCIKGDCENGYGEYIYSDKSSYKGHFKNGNFFGYGEFIYPDKDTYKGHYKDNFRFGYGVYKTSDGAYFSGNFDNDTPSKGKLVNKKGCIFINGTWDDWKMNGKEWYDWNDVDCTPGQTTDLSKQNDNNNNNNNNNNQNTTTCDQPQNPLYKYKDDKMYEYAKSGDCWWAQNVKSKKWFNLTELVKTRPNIQVSIDRLNTAETNNELIMITGS